MLRASAVDCSTACSVRADVVSEAVVIQAAMPVLLVQLVVHLHHVVVATLADVPQLVALLHQAAMPVVLLHVVHLHHVVDATAVVLLLQLADVLLHHAVANCLAEAVVCLVHCSVVVEAA